MIAYRIAKFTTIFFCIVVITNTLLFLCSHSLPYGERVSAENPYLFINSPKYWSPITDIKVSEDYLYILYDNKCTLACYDLDGNYQHSYVFKMSKNGRSQMFIVDDILYIQAKGYDYYLLKNGHFFQHFAYDSPEAQAIEDMLQDHHRTDNNYYMRGSSVWKVTTDGAKEIIHRPQWLVLINDNVQIAVYFLSLVTLVLLYFLYWKNSIA